MRGYPAGARLASAPYEPGSGFVVELAVSWNRSRIAGPIWGGPSFAGAERGAAAWTLPYAGILAVCAAFSFLFS